MKQLKEQADMMPGDVLLVASFISYVGCFTKQYRVSHLLLISFTLFKLSSTCWRRNGSHTCVR